MKKIVWFFILIVVFGISAFSQTAENICDATPLNCAVSLLKAENDLPSRNDELIVISDNYWHLERKSEAINILNLLDEVDAEHKIRTLIDFSEKSIEKGKIPEAGELLTNVFEYQEEINDLDEYYLKKLAFNLITVGMEEKAFELIDLIESNYFKTLSLIEISKSFQKKGNFINAIETLPLALKYAEKCNYDWQKYHSIAGVGKQYIELGDLMNGFERLDSVENYVNQDSDVFETVFTAYLKAGQFEKASKIVNEFPEFLNSETAFYSAQINFRAGNKEQSLKFLKQAANYETDFPTDKKSSYKKQFMIDVVKLYLNFNEPDLAFDTAKKIGNEYSQHFSFLEISKYYQNEGKTKKSVKILDFASEKAKKIQNDDNQSEMIRDDYLANLADESMAFDNFELAEKIGRLIEKKYYRGGVLAVLVLKNKTFSQKKIFSMLEEARLLFQKDNSNHSPTDKIRLWSILAHDFAVNGKKAKAREVFAEILDYISKDNKVSDLGRINNLSTAGYWFEKSELEVDEQITESLGKVAVRWINDNPPEEN